jgi:oligopeptide/dipeptide ABC transporter ATP-binding protein
MSEPLLRLRGLTVRFPVRRAALAGARHWITAVDEVDLTVEPGAAVGLVGESGCGKSTIARAVMGLVEPVAGAVEWRGQALARDDADALRRMRREVQIVFQDPVGSLDPRMTVGESVAEALEALEGRQPRRSAAARVRASLAEVGLAPELAGRYPHELSGGQCQRAAIARATVARPRLLVCDEAVSALDVSVQAQIVNLLAELRERHAMALLFISHNLAVVRHLCEEVVVLYLGRVVERARRDALFAAPRHPYTRALLAAVPAADPAVAAASEPAPSGASMPQEATTQPAMQSGCAYRLRCALADATCREHRPLLQDDGNGRFTACHHWRAPPAADPSR